jgi:hypothetical protein
MEMAEKKRLRALRRKEKEEKKKAAQKKRAASSQRKKKRKPFKELQEEESESSEDEPDEGAVGKDGEPSEPAGQVLSSCRSEAEDPKLAEIEVPPETPVAPKSMVTKRGSHKAEDIKPSALQNFSALRHLTQEPICCQQCNHPLTPLTIEQQPSSSSHLRKQSSTSALQQKHSAQAEVTLVCQHCGASMQKVKGKRPPTIQNDQKSYLRRR